MVRIKADSPFSRDVEVTTDDGAPIAGVVSVDVRIAVNDLVRATIEVQVGSVDVQAHPLLGFETLEAAAKEYGFRLVRNEGGRG